MQDTMDTETAGSTGASGDDLSALAWVHGELRRSLEVAHKALRRYLKDAEALKGGDLDAVDPSVLRNARTQLHQGAGALELVGLQAVAEVLRASESAVQRLINKPSLMNLSAVETIEGTSFAVLDFLSRQLTRKAVSPVMLFPQFRATLALAGADRVHPADLWKVDWQWRDLPADETARARGADEQARDTMEVEVLALMRDSGGRGLRRMSELCAEVGAGAHAQNASHLATLWQLAAAVFEAQANGLLGVDVYSRRMASRLLAQLRTSARGQPELSDRLAQDLLFFCARAREPATPEAAPRLAAVRQVWRLHEHSVPDYETARLGRFDPAQLALARKRVAAAKDSWSAVAGGEQHRISGLSEQFALVGESLQRLFPGGQTLAQVLQATAQQTVSSGQSPSAPLAMEVATCVLYVDACLEDGELDQPELAGRLQRLARRIDEVRQGADPQPLDVWMEELYRRVSDRQTMGSVVQELRASLSEVEKQIDHYFRNPAERQVLIPVPAQLSSMRGVLSVLGMDQASQAALHMRDAVDALAQTEVDPQRAIQTGTFDRLADNLGALSFLIDMLSVQPQLAKSLFRFDAETGSLSAVMGKSDRVSAFAQLDEPQAAVGEQAPQVPLLTQVQALGAAASQSALSDQALALEAERLSQQAVAADLPELARLLSHAHAGLRESVDPARRRALRAELAAAVLGLADPGPQAEPVAAAALSGKPTPPGGTGLEDDPEMRDIFIEEAREVVADALAAVERLQGAGEALQDMTVVRRAFHTLKGSSRMVGLRDFGEAAWSCEQLFNARLAQAPHMDAPLQLLTTEALDYFGGWAEAIAAGRDQGHHSAPVTRAADALRLDGSRVPIVPPTALDATALDATPQAPAQELQTGAAAAAADVSVEVTQEQTIALPKVPAAAEVTVIQARPRSEPAPASVDLEATQPLPRAQPPAPDVFTITLPVLTRESAPAATEPVIDEETFDLSLPELEDTSERPPASAQSITQRLPDLPAAADLDLRRRVPSPAPGAPPEPSFELDLGEYAEQPSTPPAPEVTNVAADPVELDLPLDAAAPMSGADAPTAAGVEALELDFADLDLDFGTDAPSPPPAPAPPPPLAAAPAAPEPDLLLDLGPGPEPDLLLDTAPAPEAELALDLSDAVVDLSAPLAEPSALTQPTEWVEPVEAAEAAVSAAESDESDEQVRVIGGLRIGIPLFNIYLNEADELSRRLVTELAEWALEHERRPVSDMAVALAHSLAGNSATVGYTDLSALARLLEHALDRSRLTRHGRPGEPQLFGRAADEIRRLLHQFAAGFLRTVDADLMEQLAAHERLPMESADDWPEAPTADDAETSARDDAEAAAGTAVSQTPAPELAAAAGDDIDAVDAIDAELFPIFEEEAEELLPQLLGRLRDWHEHPGNPGAAAACMRTLHTFKGGARLAGAMRLGELAHRLETEIEQLSAHDDLRATQIEPLLARADRMAATLDALRRRPAPVPEPAAVPTAAAAQTLPELQPLFETLPPAEAMEALESEAEAGGIDIDIAGDDQSAQAAPAIDWSRFTRQADADAGAGDWAGVEKPSASSGAAVRVRAGLLDRLMNNAGEVSITRSRIDSTVQQLQGSLGELTDSLERMRRQLRDIELHAETQISSRMEAAKAAAQAFDPLEMDRFTRFQELTRFMAESVNDVATSQRTLQRTLQSTEDELAVQARLTRDLQDDLLRTRMIEFESLADRLYRTVRQAAKDTGKQARLELVGGGIEIDRGVLERMAGPFEHLLRNSVAHGVELASERERAGKDAVGLITVTVAQAGNEVAVEFADDGAGLDLPRIRQRGIERGLLGPDEQPSEAELSALIFKAGFSTAETVTELAGRGVGLDVVRSEVNAMGGRIETHSESGHGTRVRLLLPLTTAVTQIVMMRCGETRLAVPSPLVQIVRRVPTAEVERAYADGHISYGGEELPFFWLASLLQAGNRGVSTGRTQYVVIVRSAAQRVAVHVDEVIGNQEVVVKNIGPQLSRLPGLAGVTLLPSGAVALIYNPVALAVVYAQTARAALAAGTQPGSVQVTPAAVVAVDRAPMVMVVDDSLTVRRVTQRLLVREGYRVVTAKDGLDALERLAEERPVVLLSDIEMPRMDGFDLVRNVRADPRLKGLPVVMITSRIAQKHRDYAAELGVDHYLGKPYSEEELLALVAGYVRAQAVH